MERSGNLSEIEARKKRCRELGKRLGDLATALIDEERVLEATAERKRLLATFADLRAPLGASLGHLHGYLITGDERLREAFQVSYDKAMNSRGRIEEQANLLTATQSQVFAKLSGLIDELSALVPDLLATAAAARTRAPSHAGSAVLEESVGIAGRLAAALTAMLEEERDLPATPERKELLAQIGNVRGPVGMASSHLRDYMADGNPTSRRLFHEFLQRAAAALEQLDRASGILTATQAAAFRTVREEWTGYGLSAARAMRAFDETGRQPGRIGAVAVVLGLGLLTAPSLLTVIFAAWGDLPFWVVGLAGLEIALILAAAIWLRVRLLRSFDAAARALEATIRGEPLPAMASSPLTARLLRAVERASAALADSSGALTAAVAEHRQQMVERRQAMLRLSENFAREIHQSIQALEYDVAILFEQVRTIRGLASTVGDEAGSVDVASAAATGNIGAIVAAIHQMSATAGDITQQVQRSATISADASGSSQRAREAVGALADTAEQIRTIVAMIEKVAAETQVLALNATIEAARAGESGRGFAVVAGEVKSLALKTTGMTQEIRTLVDAVRADTTRTADAVTEIAALIDSLGSTAGVIETATSQQGEATHEIARAATGTSDEMSGIGNAIHSLRTGVGNAQSAAGRLEELAGGLSSRASALHAEAGRFIAGVRAA